MPIPDFPTPTDDDGAGDNGTEVDAAWVGELEDALVAVIFGTENPAVDAGTVVDEVVEARGDDASLDERITNATSGTDNPGALATDIIDEVIEARDDNPDLNDRLDNIVDELPDADTDTRGLLNDGATAQSITGDKTFEDDVDIDGALTIAAGAGTEVATVGGIIEHDLTPHDTSGTGETDQSTYTLPANTLSRNGQVLVIRAAGKYPANANNKRSAIYFGGAALIQHPANTNSGAGYRSECRIKRLTASTQTCQCLTNVGGASSSNAADGPAASSYVATWDNLAIDLTATVAIKTTSSTGAGTATQSEFTVAVEG